MRKFTKIIDSATDLINIGNNKDQIKNFIAFELHHLEGYGKGTNFFTRRDVHHRCKASVPLTVQGDRLLKLYRDPINAIMENTKIKSAFAAQEASSLEQSIHPTILGN